MTRRLVAFLLRFLPAPVVRRSIPSRHTRSSAPVALGFGVLVFAALTFALEALAETRKPEWRDPEYGHRLKQVRNWQAKRPNRPLVLFVGSSRTQYGVSPDAMGFPDEPGSPVVYNFGYRAAVPPGVWLQFARALDNGVRPRAVLVQIANTEIRSYGPIEMQRPNWGARMSPADLERLAPFTEDASVYQKALATARRNPWDARRVAVLSTHLPEWQLDSTRMPHRSWELMDRYGYCPLHQDHVTEAFKQEARDSMPLHREVINKCPIGATSEQTLREIVARCRANGIPVALCWAAEAPSYRTLYEPPGLASRAGFERWVADELRVPVFPAPEHLADDDFADGYHLMPDGAARYSRWLADNHLRPWFAEVLK